MQKRSEAEKRKVEDLWFIERFKKFPCCRLTAGSIINDNERRKEIPKTTQKYARTTKRFYELVVDAQAEKAFELFATRTQ